MRLWSCLPPTAALTPDSPHTCCCTSQATPSADSTMFYYYTNELHFTPEFLGRVRLAGSLASLAGVGYWMPLRLVVMPLLVVWAVGCRC
jgi:hypothetical protein